MKVIDYNGQNVYTHSTIETDIKDLERAEVEEGKILDAYFFVVDNDRMVRKVGLDSIDPQSKESGLFVEVKFSGYGQAGIAISGLERIMQFLRDTRTSSEGELTKLKNKKVSTYNRGIQLLGIGVK